MAEEIKTEEAPMVVPVGDIRIQMADKAVVFAPKDDITGKEVALIFQMFLNGMGQRQGIVDFDSFLKAHGLYKHFAEIANESEKSQENA